MPMNYCKLSMRFSFATEHRARAWLLFTAANEIYYVISFAEIHEALDVKTEPFAAEMGEEEGGVEGRRHRRHRTKAR